jgi:hypothetical protein
VLTLADDGTQYSAKVYSFAGALESDTVELTVIPDEEPPQIVSVVPAGVSALTITFDEPVEQTSAETTDNYGVSDGVTVSSATQITPAVVRLLTSAITSEQTYTVTIGGVEDLYGNAIPAGTEFTFVARILGYSDIILADGPVAYYRFEETSGTVALNEGTSGASGNGRYVWGDEPNETEQEAKTGEGPRPPDFFGFGPANNAAQFDGPDLLDWVDTGNPFLQNLGEFSLEYWVRPEGGRDDEPSLWQNRIGIVGQNDAIEYGFINPTTIQIWTPGGGSLDTTYPFADGEWHHVATIATGDDIRNYFDGELVGTGGSPAGGDYGGSDFNVHIGGGGVFDATGNYFTGLIDEVAIFDKAIPAERIAAHYQAALGNFILPDPDRTFTTISLSGDQVTFSWDPAGGTLQEAPSVDGPWTDSADQSNPNTVTVGGGGMMMFYRIAE